jgi:hypothetical protein
MKGLQRRLTNPIYLVHVFSLQIFLNATFHLQQKNVRQLKRIYLVHKSIGSSALIHTHHDTTENKKVNAVHDSTVN